MTSKIEELKEELNNNFGQEVASLIGHGTGIIGNVRPLVQKWMDKAYTLGREEDFKKACEILEVDLRDLPAFPDSDGLLAIALTVGKHKAKQQGIKIGIEKGAKEATRKYAEYVLQELKGIETLRKNAEYTVSSLTSDELLKK